MRVLWLSNAVMSGNDDVATGTWLSALAIKLAESTDVKLGNIAQARTSGLVRKDWASINQWLVGPTVPSFRDGLPGRRVLAQILDVLTEFSPDIVHVWGTESFWGLLTARSYFAGPSLLEMQGARFAIAPVFHGGLTLTEQIKCIGLKEVARHTTIFETRRRFEKWGRFEREILAGHHNIAVQTSWMEAQVRSVNPTCRLFESTVALRRSFYESTPWQFPGSANVFCIASYSSPFKGLHVAVRSIARIKKHIPNITLRIAGGHPRGGVRRDGYIAWLVSEIEALGLSNHVAWIGPLSADQIVRELHHASVMLVPSFVENCCTAMQEAMMVGTPVIASYAGGLPSLATDEVSGLFFPPGDDAMCAHQLVRVITNRKLAEALSVAGRETAMRRSNMRGIINRQMDTYKQILADSASRVQ